MKLKRVLIVFTALAGTISLAFWFYNKPHPTADQTPFVVLSANELFKTFQADETAARENYQDKVLQVHGEIAEVMKDLDLNTVIVFKSEDPVFGVRCTLALPMDVKPGDIVHVKGICKGYLSDVILTNGIPVKP